MQAATVPAASATLLPLRAAGKRWLVVVVNRGCAPPLVTALLCEADNASLRRLPRDSDLPILARVAAIADTLIAQLNAVISRNLYARPYCCVCAHGSS